MCGNDNQVNDCCICLCKVKNRALTDTCGHEFCFECIREWSHDHNWCPMCRQTYRSIKFNITSTDLYDSLEVTETTTEWSKLEVVFF